MKFADTSVERNPLLTAALLIVVLLVIALIGTLAPPALQRTVTEALVKLVVVVGLYIFVGNSGVFSFGHIGFMAIGGYVSAILTIAPMKKEVALDLPDWLEQLQIPVLAAMPIAVIGAGLLALLVAWPFVRLKGIALPMATFALLVIIHVVTLNWTQVTGGRQALVGLPRTTGLWTAFIAAGMALIVAALYDRTRHGLALRCSRESEIAAAATGIDVASERLIAFVVSAMVVAAGGVLFAHFLGTMTANTFYLDLTFVTLTMLVVGGMRSLTGACAGVALVSVTSELFRSIERGIDFGAFTLSAPPGLQEIALALILLIILIMRPHGIVGDWELTFPTPTRPKRRAEATKGD
jgi:branched-chain amino acid transport system permease protein